SLAGSTTSRFASAPEHGIAEVVLRAGDIRDGTLQDGRIRIATVEDVFAFDATSYVAGPPSTHADSDRSPLGGDHAASGRRHVPRSWCLSSASPTPRPGVLPLAASGPWPPDGVACRSTMTCSPAPARPFSSPRVRATGAWRPLADIPPTPMPYTGGSQMHLVE